MNSKDGVLHEVEKEINRLLQLLFSLSKSIEENVN